MKKIVLGDGLNFGNEILKLKFTRSEFIITMIIDKTISQKVRNNIQRLFGDLSLVIATAKLENVTKCP